MNAEVVEILKPYLPTAERYGCNYDSPVYFYNVYRITSSYPIFVVCMAYNGDEFYTAVDW